MVITKSGHLGILCCRITFLMFQDQGSHEFHIWVDKIMRSNGLKQIIYIYMSLTCGYVFIATVVIINIIMMCVEIILTINLLHRIN